MKEICSNKEEKYVTITKEICSNNEGIRKENCHYKEGHM